MLPRPLFLILLILTTSLAIICGFYGLIAIALVDTVGPSALTVSVLLLALSMAYLIAGWICWRCFTNNPPDWLDGSKAALIAAVIGLASALPITIIGGFAANTPAVALVGFLGGVIPVQVWLARRGSNEPSPGGGHQGPAD